MDNQVCPQPSKEEEIREAIKETIRNIPNPPTTEEIDNMTHAEMVKALMPQGHVDKESWDVAKSHYHRADT